MPSASSDFSLDILFDPEDGCDVFLQNVGLPPNYTALQLRTLYSSIRTFTSDRISPLAK
jgi:hypothetical protein